ncbi:MAG: Macrolide export ATP-binding/permease protein MacB [Syntrophorhabdus sp. PtaU1.Bin153]|nr:MAG: Macrolide export ATP-binding/permease protein MacB [Syntrophorhabdus sp. PtaU1.Bin153]
MIELQRVTKVFNKGNSNEFVAVDDISLTIDPADISVLKGPSGAGKTTVLSVIGAMTKPTEGRVFIDGREITSLPERFLTGIRRKTFGFIFQQFNLIKGITALENVMIPSYPSGEKHSSLKKRAMDLLQILSLSGKAMSKIEWLSGGEAQRVAIARALINNPEIIIADEPTAHLDTKLSEEFIGIMAALNKEGKGVVIASHDPLIYGAKVVDTVVEIRDGRIVDKEERL